jgi:Carboxylesterase family
MGFMVSVHDGLWGNYGLQDQRLALQWVHDHIAVRRVYSALTLLASYVSENNACIVGAAHNAHYGVSCLTLSFMYAPVCWCRTLEGTLTVSLCLASRQGR